MKKLKFKALNSQKILEGQSWEYFQKTHHVMRRHIEEKSVLFIWVPLSRTYIENTVCTLEWRIVSVLTRGLFWCLFPELRSNEGNKYQNNTQVSTETVHHESTYIISFLTQHYESINDHKNDELYTLSPCLTRSVFVPLMTIDCWWRHNDQTIVMRSRE